MGTEILSRVQPHLRNAAPYTPVQPPEELAERLGLAVERIVKLDANENPYGPSPKALAALAAGRNYHVYPDPEQRRLRAALGRYLGLGPAWVIAGAGSDELLDLLIRLFVPAGGAVIDFPPSFSFYPFLAGVLGAEVIAVERRADYSLNVEAAVAAASRAQLIIVASPNNPTGTLLARSELDALLATGLPVVLDEAYAEFAGESFVGLVQNSPNLIVLRTMSKWAGMAGLRLGYMAAAPELIDLVLRIKQPYNLNAAAEAAALASFDDLALLQERVAAIVAERERLAALLSALPGVEVTPSRANFLLCRLERADARRVYEALLGRGVMVRYFETPLLRNHLRITAGRPQDTDAVIAALRDALAEAPPAAGRRARRASAAP